MAKVTLTKRMATNLEAELKEYSSRERLMHDLALYPMGGVNINRNQSFTDLADFFRSSSGSDDEDEWVGADVIAKALYGEGYVVVETKEEKIWDYVSRTHDRYLGEALQPYKKAYINQLIGAMTILEILEYDVMDTPPKDYVRELVRTEEANDV